MTDLKQLEFFLLRYVPNAVREEFVDIGLLVREVGGGFTQMRVTEDWSRVRCIDPEADVEVLTGLGLQLKQELEESQDWALLVRLLEDLFSNVVQLSAMKACLAKDAPKEVDTLARLYLEAPRVARKSALSGRQLILRGMEAAFEQAGVLKMLQRGIALAAYTGKKGDPQKFDFGYGFGNEVRFLDAVSLKVSTDRALLLGYGFPAMARDIFAASGGVRASLTTVVDDGLDRQQEKIGFALGMIEERGIRVATVAEMPRIAAEMRRELGT
jgi:hypothetical protein